MTERNGFTVWLTGLSAAGKSTIGRLVCEELERRGALVEVLDGDVVRTQLSRGLGFSKEDRDRNILRIGWVASRLTRAGAAVVVSAISPYRDARRRARAFVEEHGTFVEVYVATSIEECERRDPKGLYKKARTGEIAEFTGVSDPYEPPEHAELELHTEGREPLESAQLVIAKLEELGLIPSEVTA
jgi:adenylylsulfate kinase